MRTPLAISAPVVDGPLRTADVFATTLEWLGRDAPEGIDGVSRLAITAQLAQRSNLPRPRVSPTWRPLRRTLAGVAGAPRDRFSRASAIAPQIE